MPCVITDSSTLKFCILFVFVLYTTTILYYILLFRGFCRPLRGGRGGKEIHQTEKTVRVLGPAPLPEPVGLHHSGTGKTALWCEPDSQPVNTKQAKTYLFISEAFL